MWMSYHMFCHDTSKHIELIKKVSTILEKLVKIEKINKWFFIRYWIGGPHLRIRLEANNNLTSEDKKKLLDSLVQMNIENSGFQIKRDLYYSMNKAGLNETTLEEKDFPWFRSGLVEEIDYIPEVSRYGGDKLISTSETGFYLSSLLSLNFIELGATNKILITSAIMKLIFEKVIGSKYSSSAFNDASLSWRRTFSISDNVNYSRKISAVVNNDLLDKATKIIEGYPEIRSYITVLRSIRDRLKNDKYFNSILFSHYHMFNNRIGISPVMEMFIFNSLKKETELV